MTLKKRYNDIKDAHAALDRLSKNKALYRPHLDEILKLKKYYFHSMKGLEKQLKKEMEKMKKDKLTVNNLYFSHYEDGLHTLEFEVDGKKIFVKNIDVDVDRDEDYWDNAENVKKAVALASDSDIEEVIEWDAKLVQEKVTEYLESLDEVIRNGLYDVYLEKEYDNTIIGIWLEPAGMAYQGDAWESKLIGQVEDGQIMNMDI